MSEDEDSLMHGVVAPRRPELTYGEITAVGVRTLMEAVDANYSSTFFDLGSGFGRAVLQVALETLVAASVGIELDEHRNDVAQSVQRRLNNMATNVMSPEDAARVANCVRFVHGDLLHADCSLATIIYFPSLLFGEQLMDAASRKFDGLPNVRWVMSLKMLPRYRTFTLRGSVQVEMTWSQCPVYLYERLPYFPLCRNMARFDCFVS